MNDLMSGKDVSEAEIQDAAKRYVRKHRHMHKRK